ncbi:NUDIX hydrolase N-terminal domain-containing protein [Halocatena marina]|uniref:NUDIX hydrolase N-terminal domain-containing protein n=1 Tax=Halocatena marina TaxID=2934937 RepID=A0ABD5YQI9_9EURY
MTDDSADEFLALLDELRIMAKVGLRYADDPYDTERYERILELVSEWYGRSVDMPTRRFGIDLPMNSDTSRRK